MLKTVKWSVVLSGSVFLIGLGACAANPKQVVVSTTAPNMIQIDPSKVDAGYKIFGDHPAWRPSNVFNDGKFTYIVMPGSAATTFRPAFFIMNRSGSGRLTHYSVVNNTLIIPELFDHGMLQWGVGSDRQRVRIDRVRAKDSSREIVGIITDSLKNGQMSAALSKSSCKKDCRRILVRWSLVKKQKQINAGSAMTVEGVPVPVRTGEDLTYLGSVTYGIAPVGLGQKVEAMRFPEFNHAGTGITADFTPMIDKTGKIKKE